jgi:hypothetical protein
MENGKVILTPDDLAKMERHRKAQAFIVLREHDRPNPIMSEPNNYMRALSDSWQIWVGHGLSDEAMKAVARAICDRDGDPVVRFLAALYDAYHEEMNSVVK